MLAQVAMVQAAAEDGGSGLFEINFGLFVWALITFVILVILLYMFAFKPLIRIAKTRQDSIDEAISDDFYFWIVSFGQVGAQLRGGF